MPVQGGWRYYCERGSRHHRRRQSRGGKLRHATKIAAVVGATALLTGMCKQAGQWWQQQSRRVRRQAGQGLHGARHGRYRRPFVQPVLLRRVPGGREGEPEHQDLLRVVELAERLHAEPRRRGEQGLRHHRRGRWPHGGRGEVGRIAEQEGPLRRGGLPSSGKNVNGFPRQAEGAEAGRGGLQALRPRGSSRRSRRRSPRSGCSSESR